MLIRLGSELVFTYPAPTPVLLMLHIHPSRTASILKPEHLRIEPNVPAEVYFDSYGNRCCRAIVPAGRVVYRIDSLVEDSGLPDIQVPTAWQTPVEQLPFDTLRFLLASRYCEVDSELRDIAWKFFGQITPGWPRVQAICDFVHQHIRFDYQEARPTRTALEAYRERTGVCRDFTHLAMSFCRALNIPARYCTGYLGDIGVPIAPYPMDFSAWFEAYLGGNWYAFDPRNHIPRIGRVLMARGRDAADVAITTTFGPNQLQTFRVWTDEQVEAQAFVGAASE